MRDDLPIGHAEPDADAIARGYEARDVRVSVLAALFVGFVVLFSVLCGGLWWLYRHETRSVASGSPRSAIDAVTVTDAPPLQPQTGHEALDSWDLRKMHDQEDATFTSLGWKVDERTHRFAVPPELIHALQHRPAATQPLGGGR
ncbi:MAG: hypothetical protein JWM57_3036 [Phycisphaerales bacterium]|nr:hypothetical protein [Phycisphaerales bacterium]